MARLAGRQQRMPGLESAPKIEEEAHDSPKSHLNPDPSNAPRRVMSGGRAGMVRTTVNSATFTTSSTHSSAIGRGHSHVTMMQQNFKPFLDSSYLVQATAGSVPNSITGSHRSFESTYSRMTTSGSADSAALRIDNFIYVEVEVFVHEENQEPQSVSQKTLGFDVRQTVKNVINEMCSYMDIENIRPLYLLCKNTGSKLEDGTLLSNKIETEFLFELHVKKDLVPADDLNTNEEASGKTFVTKLHPNTIYLSLLLFNTGKQVLLDSNGMVPTIEISTESSIVESFGIDNKEFMWAKNRAMDYETPCLEALNMGVDEECVFNVEGLEKNISAINQTIENAHPSKENSYCMKSLKFKRNFFIACLTFCKTLKLNRLGFFHYTPVDVSAVNNTKVLVAYQFSSIAIEPEVLKENSLKWRSARNMQPNFFNTSDDEVWALFFHYYQRRKKVLAPGVYLGLFHVKNTTESMSVMALKHDPDLIPVTRLRATVMEGGSANGQTSSRLSIQRSATTESQLLNDQEISYLRYLAEKDYNPVELPPAGLKITKELEALGNQVRSAIKQLCTQCGLKEYDLSNVTQLSPINFGPRVQIILVAPLEDLQTQSSPTKEAQSGGLFRKFTKLGLGKVKEETEKSDHGDNPNFTFLPLALFETLHQHTYNNTNYTAYRRNIETLNLDQLRIDVGDEKTLKSSGSTSMKPSGGSIISTGGLMKSAGSTTSFDGPQVVVTAGQSSQMQNILGNLNEQKKKWNSTQSWAVRVIQSNRQLMMERKTGNHD